MSTETIVPDLGLETVESPAATTETTSQADPREAARAADREYESWMKTLREDAENGKHFKRIKDEHGRIQALQRIDPKGLEGIRSRYQEWDGIAHGDKKGMEAVQAIQSALAESQSVLDALTSGSAEALDNLSEEQSEGILRLTPAVLDRLAEYDSDAYAAALLPHFVGAIRDSELASAFNSMAGILQEKMPSYLTPEQRGAWIEEKFGRIMQQATTMSQWFKAQEERLKNLDQPARDQGKTRESVQPNQGKNGYANAEFWADGGPVAVETGKIAEEAFERELKPWADKLAKAGFRLSQAKKEALGNEFMAEVTKAAMNNPDYRNQMRRYNGQRTPDKASVVALFRREMNAHANSAVKSLISRDYDQLLNKQTAKPNVNKPSPKPVQPVSNGVKVVSVMPPKHLRDLQRTPIDWIYKNQWRMKDGSIVQYRP